jgi:methyltransferase (TIGR00027 family)
MSLRRIGAVVALASIEVALLPLVPAGYVLFVVKLVRSSRRSGVSATLLASFYTRWMQHQLGTRRDDACARLMPVLPNVSPLGLWLVSAPILFARGLIGYVPPIYRYPYQGVPPARDQPAARTTFFDAALARHLGGVEQLVVLGAGLDTRAFRMPPGAHLRCFEVDQPRTQAFKREMLVRAGLDADRVCFVAADFEREDWLAKLVAAGFDPGRPAFFLWESVTMYLARAAVERTLRAIAGTARGSVVAFDYFAADLLEQRSLFWRYARAVLNLVGEPLGTFGIDSTPPVRQRVAAFLASCGLSMEEQRNFGAETDRTPAKAGFTTAVVE